MATHSSILAWKIPWTEGPGWLLSMESQSQTRLSAPVLLRYLYLETATSNSSGLRLKPNSSAWHLSPSFSDPNFPFPPPLLLLLRSTLLPGCPWVTANLGNPQRLPLPHAFAPAGLPMSPRGSSHLRSPAQLELTLQSFSQLSFHRAQTHPSKEQSGLSVSSASPIRRLRDSLRLSPPLIFVTVLRNIVLTPSGHSLKYLLRVSLVRPSVVKNLPANAGLIPDLRRSHVLWGD